MLLLFIPPAHNNQFLNNSPLNCQLGQLNMQFFIEGWYVTATKRHLGWTKRKGSLACWIANRRVRRRQCKHGETFTYSVRMPSAVSRPSGVSQNTLAINLLGSAVFSFTLGHWILGGSVSGEINVTEKGTGASARALHFLHSSFPPQDHLQLASSAVSILECYWLKRAVCGSQGQIM